MTEYDYVTECCEKKKNLITGQGLYLLKDNTVAHVDFIGREHAFGYVLNTPVIWSLNGKAQDFSQFDIVSRWPPPKERKKISGWVNIYSSMEVNPCGYRSVAIYPTKESADRMLTSGKRAETIFIAEISPDDCVISAERREEIRLQLLNWPPEYRVERYEQIIAELLKFDKEKRK